MSRMSVTEAKQLLSDYEAELAAMNGHDKSGYLPFQITALKSAIREVESRGIT